MKEEVEVWWRMGRWLGLLEGERNGFGRFAGETGRWPKCGDAGGGGDGGDGGAAVRRRQWLEDGGVAMTAEKNRGRGKE